MPSEPSAEVTVEQRTGIHELKCWRESFNPIWSGEKRAELRVADRDYREGDALWLREWNPGPEDWPDAAPGEYTGTALLAEITHVHVGGKFGLAEGHVMLSLKVRARRVNVGEDGWEWGQPLDA